MANINEVKILLGIEDDLQDNLLEVIGDLTERHFKAYSGLVVVPDELNYIITELMIKRFNKLGSEGYASQSIEGLSLEFEVDELLVYSGVINNYKSKYQTVGFKML